MTEQTKQTLDQEIISSRRYQYNKLIGPLGSLILSVGVAQMYDHDHHPGAGLLIIGGAMGIVEAIASSRVPDQLPQTPEEL